MQEGSVSTKIDGMRDIVTGALRIHGVAHVSLHTRSLRIDHY